MARDPTAYMSGIFLRVLYIRACVCGRVCQQFVWSIILYTPKYQADASLPNKCEEVEGEGFGGGRDFGGGAKISALSLNRGGSQEGV